MKDERLKVLLSDKVLSYEDVIEKALQKYGDLKIGPREISVDLLNIRLRNLPGSHSAPLQKALFLYCEKETVPTPYLLGLAVEQGFLIKIETILSIEIFEEKQLFFDKFDRPTQLRLKRTTNNWLIDISEYVFDGMINASEKDSGNSINTLSFVEEKQTEEKFEEESEDLSKKMIG